MTLWPLLLASIAVAGLAWLATGLVRRALVRLGVFDRPNERSSHAVAKPRGGGLALIPVILVAWAASTIWLNPPSGLWLAMAAAVLLGAVSWVDDLRGLPPFGRLLVQAGAVGLGIFATGQAGAFFQGLLPPLLDGLVAGLLWLWFVNLFNFMDGIDGLSGVEAISIALGLALVAWLLNQNAALITLPWLLAAATAGFLIWNWEPAKLFLGDVGSVPLGYLLGWLLLSATAQGAWAPALILPAYYLADATITLILRTLRREAFWRPHRQHFYQRALKGGLSHAQVCRAIGLCNLALLGLALAAAYGQTWPALAGTALAVGLVLLYLGRAAARAPKSTS